MARREEQILEQLVSKGLGLSGVAGRAVQQEGLPTLRQALDTTQATRAQQVIGRRAEFRGRVASQRAGILNQLAKQAGVQQQPNVILQSLSNLTPGISPADIRVRTIGLSGTQKPTTLAGAIQAARKQFGRRVNIRFEGISPEARELQGGIQALPGAAGTNLQFAPTLTQFKDGKGLKFRLGGRRRPKQVTEDEPSVPFLGVQQKAETELAKLSPVTDRSLIRDILDDLERIRRGIR